MKQFVVDASALLRLYLGDGPLSPAVEDAFAMAEQADCVLLVPDLLWAEVGHVLTRRTSAGDLTSRRG